MRGQKYIAIPEVDCSYEDGHNWAKGEKYEAYDNGHTLTISSEEGGNLYLVGKARGWFWQHFSFKSDKADKAFGKPFNWTDLDGKTLQIIAGTQDGATVVMGRDAVTQDIYVLHEELSNRINLPGEEEA